MSGTLYVVATPIGNLEDMSPRARQTLAEADFIVAEDTRHTGRLLSHFGIKARQKALHDHNEKRVVPDIIGRLKRGDSVALVSDAGTPLVSDPGYRLVRAAHAEGIAVSPVPGASAVTAALSVAGLPVDRFCFEGFLPPKAAARRAALRALSTESRTIVFFESVHRIAASLCDLVGAFGADRPVFLGREVTKMHEECIAATLGELRRRIDDASLLSKGEFVLVVGGNPSDTPSPIDAELLLRELAAELPPKQAAAIAARVTGAKRNDLYRRLILPGPSADD